MTKKTAILAAIAALSAASLAGCASTQGEPTPALSAAINTLVSDAQANAPYPGLAVSVRRGDEVIYEAGHGFADLEHNARATPDTVFQVGSITKIGRAHV